MEVERSRIKKIRIPETPGLDPINVYFDETKKGSGRIIINCYDKVWTAFWGGMGDRTLSEFFSDTGDDYLCNKLNIVSSRKTPKHEEEYLKMIINAIKEALQDPRNQ